ncbi:MAG TPA: NAD(P)H-dependent oxidoreductase, partial [Solirubrobacter sp.]
MIAAVVGSVTPPGRLRRAVAEALDRAAAPSTLIDLAEHPLPFAGETRPSGSLAFERGPEGQARGRASTPEAVIGAIAEADAVLLATPV